LKVESLFFRSTVNAQRPSLNDQRPSNNEQQRTFKKMQNILNWVSSNQEIIYIVILMVFLGIEVIGRVPAVLHTPLMSGANAIHGVVIIGAIIVMGKAQGDNYLALILGFIAVVLGTLNVVGGFVVTDRMLEMFKKKKAPKSS
jgi:H+-translocating NAD(P) transhydrogenase subunit alpha